jgi:hypothetical protein
MESENKPEMEYGSLGRVNCNASGKLYEVMIVDRQNIFATYVHVIKITVK